MPLWHSFRECDREQYSHTLHAACCDDMFPNNCMYRNGENVIQPNLVGYEERLNDIQWDSDAMQKFQAAVEESDQFFFCGDDVRHTFTCSCFIYSSMTCVAVQRYTFRHILWLLILRIG